MLRALIAMMLAGVPISAGVSEAPEPVQRAAWEIVVMVTGGISAGLAVLAGIWWLLKPRIEAWAKDLVARMTRVEQQVTPNGGNTNQLGDRVVRMEQQLSDHITEAQAWRSEDDAIHRGQEREMGHVQARLNALER